MEKVRPKSKEIKLQKKKKISKESDSKLDQTSRVESTASVEIGEEVLNVLSTSVEKASIQEICCNVSSNSFKIREEENECIMEKIDSIEEVKIKSCDKNEAKVQPAIFSAEKEVSVVKYPNISSLVAEDNKVLNVPKPKSNNVISIRPYTEIQLQSFYHNSELASLNNFNECFVEAELKGIAVKQHYLYDLLSNYLHARQKITENTLELDQLRKEYKESQGQLWSVDTAVVTGRGQCQDGTTLTATHSYNKATLHRSVYQSINRILNQVQVLTYDNHVLYSYSTEELRLQIELHLQTVIANCLNVMKLEKNAAVALHFQPEPDHLKPYLVELRLCISVLFAFQRQTIRDPAFLKESREWLGRLVAVLLKCANYQDHLFLLNHILRCSAGVGSWASNFLQTPLDEYNDNPFSSLEINHIITVFDLLMSPVNEREKFLADIAQSRLSTNEALWVMVDSEGEEDEEPSGTSLRENDLVAFLNQLPLDKLFKSILLIKTENCENVYDNRNISEHHILRFFAFSTVLLKIIHKGLQTYNQPRYAQFSKRLSRFIRHIVQYATDQWEQYRKVQTNCDKAMMERLQVEYDAFFLRAIYYLYSSQKLGAWQFLAVVPYDFVTVKTLWKVFYFLHDLDTLASDLLNPLDDENYSLKIWDEQLRIQFNEKLCGLSDAESYYLLNTFANMALARTESHFILTVTMDLLQVGFINETTQESCSKLSRSLLTHITSKYSSLMSNILESVKQNLNVIGDLALYLYEELPISVWRITDRDLELLSQMLMTPSAEIDSKLARMILSRLDWAFDEKGCLFLPYDMHCNVAILAVEAANFDVQFTNWSWQTVLRLKLHISDGGFSNLNRVLGIEFYNILVKGVREKQSLSSFVSLLMTSWGHFVPLICSNGLGQILFLQQQQKHEAALFALYLIMPLFLNSQECIINCLEFQEILTNLFNADRSYISMAKNFVGTQKTVLQQFGNMIETQVANFGAYGLDTPKYLVRLWMNSLVSIANWNKDYGVLYLLDVLIRASFFHKDSIEVCETILKEQLHTGTPQENNSAISSLFKWVSSSNANIGLISNSLSAYPWLGYVIISLEHEEYERKTGLWRETLLQLHNQKGKANVDNAIKKAANIVKCTSFSSASLCIYRWAQQAMDAPVDHPLLPLLWQKFFTLYLGRISTQSIDIGCVGSKLFEGIVNFAFLKKMGKRLIETHLYYQEKVQGLTENDPEEKKLLYKNCFKIFTAFGLWLEEPRIQDSRFVLQHLPSQYEQNLLGLIIQNNTAPWYEYVDYNQIKEDQRESIKIWRISNFKEKTNVNKPLLTVGSRSESHDPVERILKRLTSYDTPKEPPKIVNAAPVTTCVDYNSKNAMFASLAPCFKTLKQFAHNHMLKVSEHKGLDCSYQELIPQLYRSAPTKVQKLIQCKGRNQNVGCMGPTIIELQIEEARINERINHQIETNRSAYESLLSKSLGTSSMSLCTAAVTLQQTIKMVQLQSKCNPNIVHLGVELFYAILSLICEETIGYLPSKTLFSSCLEKLGQSHIFGMENEMPRLLDRILKEPSLSCYLTPHFSPINVSTKNLLIMYSSISGRPGPNYDVTFDLLSKFEIDIWLDVKQPKLSERTQFIDYVLKGLTSLGFDPVLDALMLHGLYRKHLLSIFEFQFPEHYGEILIKLLTTSTSNEDAAPLSIYVWMDILTSLSKPAQIHVKVPLRDQLRSYAQNQQMLQHQELLETVELLSKHFTKERLQYGLYGLYPKCRSYLDVFALFLGMTGHALVITMLNAHQGLLSDKMAEKIWPHVRDLFVPWIAPYSMQHLKEDMASWIQQLADDRSVLLPWIPSDSVFAQKMINAFYECISFLHHCLPGSSVILNYLWQWYISSFAHNTVKEHILNPIHFKLIALPWHNFWPTLTDLELMLRVVDQYLPECHTFLGHIFISISWNDWFRSFESSPLQVKARVYQCFLNLFVKLSNEPNIRSNHVDRMKSLLVFAESLDWDVLEHSAFANVMEWYILSCDSVVIFKSDPLDLDFRVLYLLKTVAGYKDVIRNQSTNTSNKRLTYVQCYIKLVSIFTSRNKNSLSNKTNEFHSLINYQLNHLDRVVKEEEEFNVLLNEFLNILNINSLGSLTLDCFVKWISHKQGNDIAIKSILKNLALAVNNYDYVAVLYETALISYFEHKVTEDFRPNWKDVSENLKLLVPKQTELEQVLLDKSSILTLNAILIQRMSHFSDFEALMTQNLRWMENIKLSNAIEAKVPLLWFGFLELAIKNCEIDESVTGTLLYKFSQILLQMADSKGSSGWGRGLLSAIGINKQNGVNLEFRFLCRALAGFVLAQLPDMKGEPRIVRHIPHATFKVGQPGGNTECPQVLLKLDFGQSQGKIKDCAALALNQIQDPSNSLHNAKSFLGVLLKQFYSKSYLRDES